MGHFMKSWISFKYVDEILSKIEKIDKNHERQKTAVENSKYSEEIKKRMIRNLRWQMEQYKKIQFLKLDGHFKGEFRSA